MWYAFSPDIDAFMGNTTTENFRCCAQHGLQCASTIIDIRNDGVDADELYVHIHIGIRRQAEETLSVFNNRIVCAFYSIALCIYSS